jgi:hypothetical protein
VIVLPDAVGALPTYRIRNPKKPDRKRYFPRLILDCGNPVRAAFLCDRKTGELLATWPY